MPSKTLTLPVSARPIETLRITISDDEPVETNRDRITIGTAKGNDVVLSDPTVSRYHVELRAVDGGIRVTDLESTNGVQCGSVWIDEGVVESGAYLHLGESVVKVEEGGQATVEILESGTIGGIIGDSIPMRRLMARVQTCAANNSSVLIIGESGTGKELIARAIHDHGDRAERAFEIVDCAGLPAALIASELFGHERGAYTGAEKRYIGAFERANNGTIFLDELGELPPDLQSSLLGALERREFRRLGGQNEIKVDVRVIAATNRDLRAEINRKRFRLDLYMRLAVLTIEVPSLRERIDDLQILVNHFLREFGYEGKVADLLPAGVVDELRHHRWPGNVRELRNLVEATIALGEAPPWREHVPNTDAFGDLLDQPFKQARRALVDAFEVEYVKAVLRATGGNIPECPRRAGVDRTHMTHLVHRHGLKDTP